MQGLPSVAILLALTGLAAQAPTCRLEGQVLDPMRRPLRGAIVAAEHDGATVARTSTDADGFFVFGKLPQDRLRLVATSRDPEVGGLWTDLLEAKRHFVFLTTMPARAVHGTVTNSKGEPVAGAFVVAAPASGGKLGPCATTTTSGADGSYRLPHVPLGPCNVRALAPGHAAWSTEVEGVIDEPTPIQLDETDAKYVTFPLRGDAPPGLTAIAVQSWRDGEFLPLPANFASTGLVDSAFTLPAVADSDLLEVVLADPLAAEPRRHTAVGGSRTRTHTFELLQGDAAVLHLQLTGITPKRAVRALLQERDEDPPLRRIITIPADGKLTTPALVPPGERFALRLLDDRFTVNGGATHAWSLRKHVVGSLHTIACEPAHTLRVQVVDARGAPQQGVQVQWVGATEHGRRWAPLGAGTTGRDGVEVLRGLRIVDRRMLQLQLRSPHGWGEDLQPAAEGDDTDLGTQTLQAGGELLLQVLDGDGKPSPGGRIEVHDPSGAHWQYAAADRQGRVLLTGLPPGPYFAMPLRAGERSPTVQVQADERTELVVQAR